MSGITLRIDKGKSPVFTEIMSLLQAFPGLKECKRHYSVRLTEEDVFRFRNELERIMQLDDRPASKKTTINVVFTMYLQYLL